MERFLELIEGLDMENRYLMIDNVPSLVGMKPRKRQLASCERGCCTIRQLRLDLNQAADRVGQSQREL